MQARATVLLPVKNRETFREAYLDGGDGTGLFIEGDLDVALGEEVDLEIHFLEEQVSLRIRGQVRWRRAAGSRAQRSIPPGVGVEFLPEEAAARATLLDFASGRDVPLTSRAARRFGVALKVRYKQGGVTVTDTTDDISEGGAFILSEDPLPVGTRLEFKLVPPKAFFGIGIKAVVAWRRDRGRRGFGVEFLFDSPRQQGRTRRLIGELRGQLLRELKVRTPRASRGSVPPSSR